MSPYRGVEVTHTPAKAAAPGHYWHPKHPVDWQVIPLSCLLSGFERVHWADQQGQPCVCEERPKARWPWWQRHRG